MLTWVVRFGKHVFLYLSLRYSNYFKTVLFKNARRILGLTGKVQKGFCDFTIKNNYIKP